MVIAIMGLLAGIVLINLGQAREKAKLARAQIDLNQIRTAIILVRDREDKVLGEITGVGYCSECACRTEARTNPNWCDSPSAACLNALTNAFNAIGLPLMRDPWGCPYLIDANELEEYPSPPPRCRHDTVNSAGPNRMYFGGPGIPVGPCSGYHDEEATPCDDDGPRVKVPFYQCGTADIFCDWECPQQ